MVKMHYIIEHMMVPRKGDNNFKIVEMRWHEDIRYNRRFKMVKR